MQHSVKVAMYFGSQQFFNALVELKDKLVLGSGRCNRLVASRLNLEFSFNGEKKLITDGTELLAESIKCAKDGLFTQEDANFAVEQLNRIGLVYNSQRTLYHVQYEEAQAEINAADVKQSSSVSDDKAEHQEESKESVEENSTEALTDVPAEDTLVEAEEKAPAKRGRKATK